MKYLLLSCFFLIGCAGVTPQTNTDVKHPNYPHTHFSEAQVESVMFEFWSPIIQRKRKCVGSMGVVQRFVSPETDRSYYGDRCDVMPNIAVVKCSNSVNTNNLVNSKTIEWACSMYLQDNYVFVRVMSESDVARLVNGLMDGSLGI